MYTNNKHAFYIRGKPVRIPSKWELIRSVGRKTLSDKAQLKLEWIIFYHTRGNKNATDTAKHFGVTRKTIHKWLVRFDEKSLSTLEEESRAPDNTRKREINFIQRGRIRNLRNKHIKWGKMKLKRRYFKIYHEHISSWKIQKVIEDEKLYFNLVEHQKQQKKRKQAQNHPKMRIAEFEKKDVPKPPLAYRYCCLYSN